MVKALTDSLPLEILNKVQSIRERLLENINDYSDRDVIISVWAAQDLLVDLLRAAIDFTDQDQDEEDKMYRIGCLLGSKVTLEKLNDELYVALNRLAAGISPDAKPN